MSESLEKRTSPDSRDPFAALEYIIHEEETLRRLLEEGEQVSQKLQKDASRKRQLESIRSILTRLSEGTISDELKVKLDQAWDEFRDLESKFA